MAEEAKIVPIETRIAAHFDDIRGKRISAGSHRDDDVVMPITGNIIKWREHEWFTTLKTVDFDHGATGEIEVTLVYDWLKNTKFRLAPGIEERPEANAGGNASITFTVDVTSSGKIYVDNGTLRLIGDEGPTEGPIIERIRTLNGRRD